jgi:hypothetical protein
MLNEEDMRRKSYVERKAALRKLLRDRGIQYVEPRGGARRQDFCRCVQTRPGGHRFKKAGFALSIGAVEGLDQVQKSEGSGYNSGG